MLAIAAQEPSREEAFNHIYHESKIWGINANGECYSGGGSLLQTTEQYRQFLQDFFTAYHIRSVIDAGCGDWEFSRALNWAQIDYVGYDVIASLILKNQEKYGSSHIRFVHADAIDSDLPTADLLICKDVLQHLPHEDILMFARQFPKFKYCLITNDVNPETLTSDNPQTYRGGFRFLDLTKPPFSLPGVKILTFKSGPTIKQIFLLSHQN